MTTLSPGTYTYAEWAARSDPDGKLSALVNLRSQSNEILLDMTWDECTSGNAYQFTQVVLLPTPTRRAYNQGVVRTMAGSAKQITTTSEYSDWVVLDRSLAKLGGQPEARRASEVSLHMEGMTQTVAGDLFYANRATDPTSFTGLANIYSTVNPATSAIASNVIDGLSASQSTNTSMWLIGWGPKQIHGIFPQGMPMGLTHEDMGIFPINDTSGNQFPAYLDWLQWDLGIVVHDWRYAVRACNIDTSVLFGSSAPNLINILSQMVMKPPVMPAGVSPVQTSDDPERVGMAIRSAIYVNRTVYLALDQQAQNKTNVLLGMMEWDGHVILGYRGIPIRIVDALLNTESLVV